MFARFDLESEGGKDCPPTHIYGWNTPGTEEVIEAFATHRYASGASQGQLGRLHQYVKLERIEQAEFNAAFLNCMPDELDDEDRTMNLGELMTKYPIEE
jgi:hypothetical protein